MCRQNRHSRISYYGVECLKHPLHLLLHPSAWISSGWYLPTDRKPAVKEGNPGAPAESSFLLPFLVVEVPFHGVTVKFPFYLI